MTCFIGIGAQENYKITYLGSSNGLSNNSVRCVFQDSRGMIWLGTYDGLNGYDGYEFKVFRNRINDTTSLPHNYISAINEDDDHNLWIGMGQGAVCYNVFTNVFTPVYYQPLNTRKKERVSMYINSIEKDESGNMFLATSANGLLWKPKHLDIAKQIPILNSNGEAEAWYTVQDMQFDKQKRLWVFVAGSGLFRFNDKSSKLDPVTNAIGGYSVNRMRFDHSGNLWLATSTGLLQYNIAQNKIIQQVNSELLGVAYVSALSLDRNGLLWIGTDGGGVKTLNTKTGVINSIDGRSTTGKLSSNSILSLFIDKEQRQWIGTNKGGVNIADVYRNDFNTIRQDFSSNSLSSNFITSFYEDVHNNLWIGTDGGGLNKWDAARKHFTSYQTPVLSNNTISSITQDKHHNLWIATFGGGVNKRTPSGTIEHYKLLNQADSVENKIAIRIYQDSKDNLWVTTYENGHLYLYNKSLNTFEIYDPQFGDLMSIKEDSQGQLWVGSPWQLIRVDQINRKHQYYPIGKTVRCIFEDSKKNFWIGAEGGGLILFDRKSGKIAARISEEEGLSSNTVMNILEDGQGYLWISTSNGLNRFDPKTRKINRFYESDGLQNNQFSYRAALKLKSGELAFGGNNGFNLFDPTKMYVRTYFPKVVLTSLKVNNKLFTDQIDYKTNDIGEIVQLIVPYDEAILYIQFAALEFSAPNKIKYAYYLEGWDKDWSYSGSSRSVTYNNIREGSYKLRIKSTNAEGTWNTKETVVHIKVLPPWYRTWWAYCVYLLALSAVIYLYLRYKTAQEKIKYDLKLSRLNAEMRKTELESERMEKEVQRAELEKTHAEFAKEKAERITEKVLNEKEKEINQKRLSFFTNISHEFRTPLTMIINPVQDLMRIQKGKEKEELRVIGLNAARLLSLTDQLMLFRKIEEGAEGMLVSQFDFSKLCDAVFSYFKYEARTRNIHYKIEGIDKPIDFFGDRAKVEIILYNLIANAFKYTPKDGQILIKIACGNKTITTIIEDTGAGIPKGTGNAIFERFYQAPGHVKLGFGIGLYMVKQFTEWHKGNIAYTSEPKMGTSFTVKLPTGKEHFGDIQIMRNIAEEAELTKEIDIEEDPELTPAFIPEAPALTAKKAILVVDDDDDLRKYITSVLGENYLIYQAVNGRDGLKLALQKKPDLIISDVAMPEMDGIALCQAIKNDVSVNHLPVILLTAHTSKDLELKGTEEGADYYITKPFNKDLLLARVNRIFKNSANLQQYFYDQITLKKSRRTRG